MNSSAELEQEAAMDPQAAELILADAREQARHELEINYPVLFLAWGLALLIGYGALWLAVHGQHPYRGLTKTGGAVWLVLFVVALFSVTIRLGVVGRAVTGVGRAGRQWGIFFAVLPLGSAVLFIEAAALAHAGASRQIVDVLIAAAPIVSMGLVLCASSAVRLDYSMLALGIWLLATAAGGTWASPVAILAVYSLAGGGGFLLAAAIQPWVRRT
ncbi:MAG: hypothetical protein ABSH51_12300 [Solirubrobacteraceae bacterium]